MDSLAHLNDYLLFNTPKIMVKPEEKSVLLFNMYRYDDLSKRLDSIEGKLDSLKEKVNDLDKNFATFKENTKWWFRFIIFAIIASPFVPELAKKLLSVIISLIK